MPETINGTVSKIKFRKGDFIIAQVSPSDRSRQITIVGEIPNLVVGSFIEVVGTYENHATFGTQLRIEKILQLDLRGDESIIQFLSSDLFPGIGFSLASKIVRHFGENTIKILDSDPANIRKVDGITDKTAASFIANWSKNRATATVIYKLVAEGLPYRVARKVFNAFGETAPEMVKENPYVLCRIPSLGFRTVDEYALRLGIRPDSPLRREAALIAALFEIENEGHCWTSLPVLAGSISDMIGIDVSMLELTSVVKDLCDREIIAREGERIYAINTYAAEVDVADFFKTHSTSSALLYEEVVQVVKQHEHVLPSLSDEQLSAVVACFSGKNAIITGGPGTGKTTIAKAVCIVAEHFRRTMSLAAPTGRAAKRLSEATLRGAKTIHRLLVYNPVLNRFMHDEGNPLQIDMLLLDESSMIDIKLMASVVRALESNDVLLMFGDANQLPSVGCGSVLSDLIESGAVEVVKLTRIYRQTEGSSIVSVAKDILDGVIPDLPTPKLRGDANCLMVQAPSREDVDDVLHYLFETSLPKVGIKPSDIQVISPMKKHFYGTELLNDVVRDIVNPQQGFTTNKYDRFRLGDRVMQTRNNYELNNGLGVFNGDVGYVVEVNPEVQSITVNYPDMDPVVYSSDDQDQLMLSYVITVHKSQGGEYPCVLLILHDQHSIMLRRRLIYTAVTRAKQLCIIIGTHNAWKQAIINSVDETRRTSLVDRVMT